MDPQQVNEELLRRLDARHNAASAQGNQDEAARCRNLLRLVRDWAPTGPLPEPVLRQLTDDERALLGAPAEPAPPVAAAISLMERVRGVGALGIDAADEALRAQRAELENLRGEARGAEDQAAEDEVEQRLRDVNALIAGRVRELWEQASDPGVAAPRKAQLCERILALEPSHTQAAALWGDARERLHLEEVHEAHFATIREQARRLQNGLVLNATAVEELYALAREGGELRPRIEGHEEVARRWQELVAWREAQMTAGGALTSRAQLDLKAAYEEAAANPAERIYYGTELKLTPKGEVLARIGDEWRTEMGKRVAKDLDDVEQIGNPHARLSLIQQARALWGEFWRTTGRSKDERDSQENRLLEEAESRARAELEAWDEAYRLWQQGLSAPTADERLNLLENASRNWQTTAGKVEPALQEDIRKAREALANLRAEELAPQAQELERRIEGCLSAEMLLELEKSLQDYRERAGYPGVESPQLTAVREALRRASERLARQRSLVEELAPLQAELQGEVREGALLRERLLQLEAKYGANLSSLKVQASLRENATSRINAARGYLAQNDPDNALRLLEDIPDSDAEAGPLKAQARLLRARRYLGQRRDYSLAEQDLRAALADPAAAWRAEAEALQGQLADLQAKQQRIDGYLDQALATLNMSGEGNAPPPSRFDDYRDYQTALGVLDEAEPLEGDKRRVEALRRRLLEAWEAQLRAPLQALERAPAEADLEKAQAALRCLDQVSYLLVNDPQDRDLARRARIQLPVARARRADYQASPEEMRRTIEEIEDVLNQSPAQRDDVDLIDRLVRFCIHLPDFAKAEAHFQALDKAIDTALASIGRRGAAEQEAERQRLEALAERTRLLLRLSRDIVAVAARPSEEGDARQLLELWGRVQAALKAPETSPSPSLLRRLRTKSQDAAKALLQFVEDNRYHAAPEVFVSLSWARELAKQAGDAELQRRGEALWGQVQANLRRAWENWHDDVARFIQTARASTTAAAGRAGAERLLGSAERLQQLAEGQPLTDLTFGLREDLSRLGQVVNICARAEATLREIEEAWQGALRLGKCATGSERVFGGVEAALDRLARLQSAEGLRVTLDEEQLYRARLNDDLGAEVWDIPQQMASADDLRQALRRRRVARRGEKAHYERLRQVYGVLGNLALSHDWDQFMELAPLVRAQDPNDRYALAANLEFSLDANGRPIHVRGLKALEEHVRSRALPNIASWREAVARLRTELLGYRPPTDLPLEEVFLAHVAHLEQWGAPCGWTAPQEIRAALRGRLPMLEEWLPPASEPADEADDASRRAASELAPLERLLACLRRICASEGWPQAPSGAAQATPQEMLSDRAYELAQEWEAAAREGKDRLDALARQAEMLLQRIADKWKALADYERLPEAGRWNAAARREGLLEIQGRLTIRQDGAARGEPSNPLDSLADSGEAATPIDPNDPQVMNIIQEPLPYGWSERRPRMNR